MKKRNSGLIIGFFALLSIALLLSGCIRGNSGKENSSIQAMAVLPAEEDQNKIIDENSGSLESIANEAQEVQCEKNSRNYNIVLISIDTLRADHVGAYGYDRNTTPNIDEFAKESVLFEKFFVQSPFTPVSHRAILTGKYPNHNEGLKTSQDKKMVSEYLKEQGYGTGGVVDVMFLNENNGFSEGYDFYDSQTRTLEIGKGDQKQATADKISEKATNYLRSQDGKFFLFTHYYDVHADGVAGVYYSPEPYSTMFYNQPSEGIAEGSASSQSFMEDDLNFQGIDKQPLKNIKIQANYDGGIAYVDKYVGELLEKIKEKGIWDNTMIIILSDHGEQFYDHKGLGHFQVYNEILNAPLIIKFPNSEFAGKRIKQTVQAVDLLPTILDCLCIEKPARLNGKSLMPLVNENSKEFKEIAYAVFSQQKNNRIQSLVEGEWKLIKYENQGKENELYNFLTDFHETINEIDEMPEIAEELEKRINAISTMLQAGDSITNEELSKEDLEALKALGYIN